MDELNVWRPVTLTLLNMKTLERVQGTGVAVLYNSTGQTLTRICAFNAIQPLILKRLRQARESCLWDSGGQHWGLTDEFIQVNIQVVDIEKNTC